MWRLFGDDDLITRDKNLVVATISTINEDTSATERAYKEFINPRNPKSLDLGKGYYKVVDGDYMPRSKEEIEAIVDYLQSFTGLNPYMQRELDDSSERLRR